MSDIEKFQDASGILQQVDVTDIITNLALGIAEAQQKLDDNSVKQIIKLSEQEVGGKSLLELGFVPAFYAFDYADVSASISIKMKVNTSTSLAIAAKLDFAKQKGYDKEHLDLVEDLQSHEDRKEFKSSKDVFVKANESTFLTVQNKSVSMNQQQGSVSRVRDFERQLREAQGVTRASKVVQSKINATSTNAAVSVSNSGGFTTIYVKPVATDPSGILRISSYPGNSFDIDATGSGVAPIPVATNFSTVFGLANTAMGGGYMIGFSKSDMYRIVSSSVVQGKLKVYFEWDKDDVDLTYDGHERATPNQPQPPYQNTYNDTEKPLRDLAAIMAADPSLKIRLIGNADASSLTTVKNEKYNDGLGLRRAEHVRDLLVGYGAIAANITPTSQGESGDNTEFYQSNQPSVPNTGEKAKWRFVEVELTTQPDYIYFEGGAFTVGANPTPSATDANKFILITAGGTISPFTFPLNTAYGNFTLSADASISTLDQSVAASMTESGFYHEVVNNMVYILHEESSILYTVYSAEEEEINMSKATSSSSGSTENESSYYFTETINRKHNLKKDAENIKNPSTLAVGASVDFRTSRQFEMSMEGNSSISARLKAIPPPDGLVDILRNGLTE